MSVRGDEVEGQGKTAPPPPVDKAAGEGRPRRRRRSRRRMWGGQEGRRKLAGFTGQVLLWEGLGGTELMGRRQVDVWRQVGINGRRASQRGEP